MTTLPDLGKLRADPTLHNRASDQLAAAVRGALKNFVTERITWDVAFQLVPTQQGPQPGFAVLLQIASPVLGQKLNHVVLLPVDDIRVPMVENAVRQAVEALRKQRSEIVAGPHA